VTVNNALWHVKLQGSFSRPF